jgi:hypothetical protein
MDSFDPYQQWLGISRREQPPNRYRLIGVGVFEFDPEVIRESADRQIENVRKHGRGPQGGLASKLLSELRDTRDCLLNAKRKADYDRELRQQLGMHDPQAPEAEDIELELVEPTPKRGPSRPPVAEDDIELELVEPMPKRAPPRSRPAAEDDVELELVEPVPKRVSPPSRSAASAPPPMPPVDEISELNDLRAPRPATKVKSSPAPSVRPAPKPMSLDAPDDEDQSLEAAMDESSAGPPRRRRSKGPLPTLIGAVGGGLSACLIAYFFWPQLVALRNGGQPVVVEHRTERHSPPRTTERREKPRRPEPVEEPSEPSFPKLRPRPAAPRPERSMEGEMEGEPPAEMPEAAPPPRPTGPRRPVLNEQETQEAVLQVRRRFRDEYRGNSTDDQTALALVLVDQARKAQDDPKLRYGLLLEARKAAIAAGHAELVVKSIDDLAAEFDVDPLALKIEGLGDAMKHVKDEDDRHAFIDAAFRTIDAAVAANEYAAASQVAGFAQNVATKLRDNETRKQVAKRVTQLQAYETHLKDVKTAQETIATAPDDAGANTVIGKHLCLYEDKWDQGLPMLARGSDEKLAAAAKQELADPTEVAPQIAAGDFWWDFAQTEVGLPRRGALSRAAHWYTKSGEQATGINKIKIDKRLKMIADENAKSGRRWRSPLAE